MSLPTLFSLWLSLLDGIGKGGGNDGGTENGKNGEDRESKNEEVFDLVAEKGVLMRLREG